jgi:hypothetical protein
MCLSVSAFFVLSSSILLCCYLSSFLLPSLALTPGQSADEQGTTRVYDSFTYVVEKTEKKGLELACPDQGIATIRQEVTLDNNKVSSFCGLLVFAFVRLGHSFALCVSRIAVLLCPLFVGRRSCSSLESICSVSCICPVTSLCASSQPPLQAGPESRPCPDILAKNAFWKVSGRCLNGVFYADPCGLTDRQAVVKNANKQ